MPVLQLDNLGQVDVSRHLPGHLISEQRTLTEAEKCVFRREYIESAFGIRKSAGVPNIGGWTYLIPTRTVDTGETLLVGVKERSTPSISILRAVSAQQAQAISLGTNGQAWTGFTWGDKVILNSPERGLMLWENLSLGRSSPNAFFIPTAQQHSGWPRDIRFNLVTNFKNRFIGLGVSSGGEVLPYRFMFSSEAPLGELPASWDITDPASTAGAQDLNDNLSPLIGAQTLRGDLYVYKERGVYRVRHIGAPFIFSYEFITDSIGLLARRCVVEWQGRQILATPEDLIVFDGYNYRSLLDTYSRREIFEDIERSEVENCFFVEHYKQRQLYFCYPSLGHKFANKVVIIDLDTFSISYMSLDTISIAAAVEWRGDVVEGSGDSTTWATIPGNWIDLNRDAAWVVGADPEERTVLFSIVQETSATSQGIADDCRYLGIYRPQAVLDCGDDEIRLTSSIRKEGLHFKSRRGHIGRATLHSILPIIDFDDTQAYMQVLVRSKDRVEGTYGEYVGGTQGFTFRKGSPKVSIELSGVFFDVELRIYSVGLWKLSEIDLEYSIRGESNDLQS